MKIANQLQSLINPFEDFVEKYDKLHLKLIIIGTWNTANTGNILVRILSLKVGESITVESPSSEGLSSHNEAWTAPCYIQNGEFSGCTENFLSVCQYW